MKAFFGDGIRVVYHREMNEFMSQFSSLNGLLPAGAMLVLIVALSIWSLVWKGIALWKAARLSHKNWFIALLIVNTLGLLEIVYIFLVARKEEGEKKEE